MSLLKTDNVYLFIPNLIGKLQVVTVKNCAEKIGTGYFFSPVFITGYSRIVLAVISFYFMPTNYIVASTCYVISVLLDALDGHAARAFNQCEY